MCAFSVLAPRASLLGAQFFDERLVFSAVREEDFHAALFAAASCPTAALQAKGNRVKRGSQQEMGGVQVPHVRPSFGLKWVYSIRRKTKHAEL